MSLNKILSCSSNFVQMSSKYITLGFNLSQIKALVREVRNFDMSRLSAMSNRLHLVGITYVGIYR